MNFDDSLFPFLPQFIAILPQEGRFYLWKILEKKFPSQHDYKRIIDDEARWARKFLLELLQERLGMFIVTKDGKLNNELLTKLERAIDDKGGETSEKAIKKLFCADSELAQGYPAGKTILAFKTYIESGKKLECPVSTTKELTTLAKDKVAELKLHEKLVANEQTSMESDSLPLVNSEYKPASETVPLKDLQNDSGNHELPTSQPQNESGILRFYSLAHRWKIGSWISLGLCFILLIASLISLRTNVSSGTLPLDETSPILANGISPLDSTDSIKVTIIPFFSMPKCPDIEVEKAIEERLKEVIAKQKLNVIVELLHIDTVPDDKTPQEAIVLGASRHANIIVHGRFTAQCPNLTSIEPRYELVDSSSVHSFPCPEITWAGLKTGMNDPMEIVYGNQVLNGLWYFIYWNLGGKAYDRRDFDTALKLFQAADSVIKNGVAGHLLGSTYEKLLKPKEASAAYERYLQLIPNAIATRTQLARIYVNLGENRNANFHFKQIQLQYPGNADASLEYALFLNKTHEHDKAFDLLNNTLQQKPDFIPGHIALGDLYSDVYGNSALSINEYKKACLLDSSHLFVNAYYLQRLFRMGEFELLKQELVNQYKSTPKSVSPTLVGMYCYMVGEFDKARILLRPFVYRHPLVVDYLDYYIWSFYDNYSAHEISQELQSVVRNVPEAKDHATLLLAEYYHYDAKNPDSAFFYYEKAYSNGYLTVRCLKDLSFLLVNDFSDLEGAINVLRSNTTPNYELDVTLASYLINPQRKATHSDSLEARDLIYSFLYDFSTDRKELCPVCSSPWVIAKSDSMKLMFEKHFSGGPTPDIPESP